MDRVPPKLRVDLVYAPSDAEHAVAPARRMSPERRREQLVRTALALFADRPPELVAVEDVVRAADVSRALFYRYFPNIHELRVAALRAAVDEVIAAITPPAEGTLLDQLHYSLSAFLGSAQAYASAYVALMRTGSLIATEETNALVDRVRKHVVGMVGERLRPGEPVTPMLELTLRSWFAVVEGASVSWLREGVPGKDQLRNWLVDQLVAMVATTARHDPATAGQLAAVLGDAAQARTP